VTGDSKEGFSGQEDSNGRDPWSVLKRGLMVQVILQNRHSRAAYPVAVGAGGFSHNNGYGDFRMDLCTGPIHLLIIDLNHIV
jgi:hypothetical protein